MDVWKTTTTILERLQAADDVAWAEFDVRFRPAIISFARGFLLSVDQAEDIAQETLAAFIRAYRDGKYDRESGRLSSWLFGFAKNQVLAARRKIYNQRAREKQSPEVELSDAVLQHTWDETWKSHKLRMCLEQVEREVEPQTFEAFNLAAIRKVPPAEVADQLNISSNAVYLARHRILKRLRELSRDFEEISK